MKKLFLCISMMVSLSASSQKYVIRHCVDQLNDREYFLCMEKLICANDSKTRGFLMTPMFDTGMKKNGIRVELAGFGVCNEKDQIIILFEDDTKISSLSWYTYNCDGNCAFDFSEDDYLALSTKKIKVIRVTNGRTYESLTYTLKQSEQDFFIRAYTNNVIQEINCSKY